MRAQKEDIEGYGEPGLRLDMDYGSRRITVPDVYEEREGIRITRHHLDTNHHVNNARYVEIAKELLPEDFVVRELRAEYKKAAVLGDYMIPRVTKSQDGYVTALCDHQGGAYAVIMLRE